MSDAINMDGQLYYFEGLQVIILKLSRKLLSQQTVQTLMRY